MTAVVPPAPGAVAPTDEERIARAELSRVFEPGDPRQTTLVAELGAVLLRERLLAEQDLAGVRTDYGARLAATDGAQELDRAARLGIRFVVPGDEEWPPGVDDLYGVAPVQERGGPPIGLWVRGPVPLTELAAGVAVVGSRSATSYGEHVARGIAAEVAEAGLPVVSGAAFGIDRAAHLGAMAGGGATVAVLACGADRAYPKEHAGLLSHLVTHGAVVSEAAPGCAPQRIRFLARNRLIAALTGATVVVEAALRSGALSTGNWAGRLGRPLLGVPGPVSSASSAGVHQLIRSGAAGLATCAAEVLEVVGRPGEHLPPEPRAAERPRDRLTSRQRQVLDGVPVHLGVGADSIARSAGLGLVEVRGALDRLERAGHVERDAAGWRLAAAGHD